ncbi:Protoheme IX farnesyltransferase, mitochondrial [Agyrium rufum]|nr:Protoheme IX farnesyltransferase, mitochondrial [Agyrium rufum]
MYLEPEHDAKMSRTRNRPLVRQVIPPRNALAFAAATSVLGVAGLYYGVNPTVAFLGGFTIFLYAGVYTPLKRISVVNTWVGAVVGGIPPLMGWAAASGQTAVSDGTWQELLLGPGNAGGWLLAGLLFAWQFPHFNALSYMIREEYAHAGYRMLASVNPARNARVALRYSLLFFPICVGLSYAGVTDWGFAVTSTIVNAWITREAIRFWRKGGAEGSARTLFWAGVWHLPVLMVLAMAHKSGLWHGVWEKLGFGEEINEEEWEYEEEHAESPIKTGVAIDTDGHEIASDQVLAARHLAT